MTTAGVNESTATEPPSWSVGEVTVTKILETELHWPFSALLPAITEEVVDAHPWAHEHYIDERGRMILSVHALVVEAAGKTIIVDTCVGNDKPRPVRPFNQLNTTFLDDLTAAGFAPEDIDLVICTHLHVDHVGWNTRLVDGKWVPTFPKARYLFCDTEYAYWHANSGTEELYEVVFADSVAPIVAAGLADLVSADHVVTEQVRLTPTPGHTPGHVSVIIESGGSRAIILGDMTHHPIQFSRPDIASSADVDQAESTRTRERFVSEHLDEPILIIGTHFAGPTAGHLVTEGDARVFSTD